MSNEFGIGESVSEELEDLRSALNECNESVDELKLNMDDSDERIGQLEWIIEDMPSLSVVDELRETVKRLEVAVDLLAKREG